VFKLVIIFIGLAMGVLLGMYLPITYSSSYSLYMSVAILAALDSVFGAIRSNMEKRFNTAIFVSGFFGNAILAAFLAYIGDRLGVPLYYAAIFAFGDRLFQNFAIIRRYLIDRFTHK
jgi:small basic protein